MNCCNANGECTQGRDCPIRKQRAKEANDAYIARGSWGKVSDPYDDVAETFKALLAVIAVTATVTLISFFIWGK
tara:strand:+ start:532 stop:753 length:222 start_codon:yes stop_codon:yes gene_type:complete